MTYSQKEHDFDIIKDDTGENGILNKNLHNKTLFTVITVVFHGEKHLEKTMQSVINQNYDNFKYIIIDGGSTDGTLDIIKKNEDQIDYWVSERDSGIYNAMNKAIELASGEWLCFMNCGDVFYNSGILSIVKKKLDDSFDVAYGDWVVNYPHKIRKVSASKNIHDIWKGMIFSHQSSFIKKEVLKQYRFNEYNPITADFELFYKLYKDNKNFCYLPFVIASVSSGGVSDVKRIESIVSRYRVIDKNLKTHGYYGWLIVKELMKSFLKKIVR